MNSQQRAAMQMALEALEEAVAGMGGSYATWSITGKEAITALREALAQPQGEPVAWMIEMNGKQYFTAESGIVGHIKYDKEIPLYTTPPSVEAAIEATLEKAAKVCEEIYTGEEAYGDHPTPEMCAAAIRSMK